VDIARGSEGALPSGLLTLDFVAGVMGLAGLLATEPRVVLEVWHKER
jgi:centrosomal protein CEP120